MVSAACALLAGIAAGWVVAIFGAVLVRLATNAYGATGDFLSFYAAGWLVRAEHAADLYEPNTIEWAQRLLYPGDFDRAIGYPLPMFVAWAFAPLTTLPFTEALFLWMTLNAGLLAIVLWTLSAELVGLPRGLRLLFVWLAALSFPAVATIVFGQVDLIVLVSLLVGYRLLLSGRTAEGAAALSLTAVKPHLALGVVFLLAARREWRGLSVFFILAAALIAIPPLVVAPAALTGNVRMLLSYPTSTEELSVNAEVMSNWRGFVVSVTGSSDPSLWLPGLVALAIVSLALAVPRWVRANSPREFDRAYSLALLVPLIVSPHLHTQSLVLLLLPAALATRWAWAGSPTPARCRIISNSLLFAYASVFFFPFFAIQGLSLTVFFLMASYLWVALRWPNLTEANVGEPISQAFAGPVESAFVRRAGVAPSQNP